MAEATRNSQLLESFTAYCREHPEQRFWQALCNWAGVYKVLATWHRGGSANDTFYWEDRNPHER